VFAGIGRPFLQDLFLLTMIALPMRQDASLDPAKRGVFDFSLDIGSSLPARLYGAPGQEMAP
jgi:hypothetical protein